jgi:hypothetical protein
VCTVSVCGGVHCVYCVCRCVVVVVVMCVCVCVWCWGGGGDKCSTRLGHNVGSLDVHWSPSLEKDVESVRVAVVKHKAPSVIDQVNQVPTSLELIDPPPDPNVFERKVIEAFGLSLSRDERRERAAHQAKRPPAKGGVVASR